MKRVVTVAVLVAASRAHAESPIGGLVGTSVALGSITPSDGGTTAVLAVRADIGYRVHPSVVVGVHLGTATGSEQLRDIYYMPGDSDRSVTKFRPLDAGVSVMGRVGETGLVLGWVGIERSVASTCTTADHSNSPDTSPSGTFCSDWSLVKGTSPALGITVGKDVFTRGPHHLSVIGSFETALETKHRPFGYKVFGLGVAYRF